MASGIFIWLYEYLMSISMSDAAEKFENTIEGVTGLTYVHDPVAYTNIQVFSGQFGKSEPRPINLRVLPSNKTKASLEETFLATARNWRKVATHPNVVELIEWNDEPEPWMIVASEYSGRLMNQGGELSVSEVSEIVSAIAEALRNAALYNVSHHNLRPEYIRLSPNSTEVQVDDWGLERSVAEDRGKEFITAYTAPEQLDSSLSSSDKQTDVYGLAGLAYFALTGTSPLTPRKQSILKETPVPPSKHADDIPKSLDGFLAKCLDKKPDSRPENPFVFSTQFEQAADPTRSQPVVRGSSNTGESYQSTTDSNDQYQANGALGESTIDQTDESIKYDRRTIFKTGTLLVAFTAIAALSRRYLFSNSVDEILGPVPPKMDFVSDISLTDLFSDETLKQNINQELAGFIDTGNKELVNGLANNILPSLELNFKRINNIVAFGKLTASSSQYFGLIIRSDWNSDTISNALEQAQVSLEEDEYMDITLYKIQSNHLPWTVFLSFLKEGEMVLGTRTEVEDVIIQYEDTESTPDGEARQGFQSASQEPVRFGFEVSTSMTSQLEIGYNIEQLVENVSFGYGSIQQTPELPVTLTFRAVSNSAAKELESQLSAIILFLRDRGGQLTTGHTNIRPLLENTEVRREEAEVDIHVSNGVELLSIGFDLMK